MQNLIKPCILGNETWGESIAHLEILDVQSHVLPNLKLKMPLCFVGMLLIPLLSMFQKLFGSGIFCLTPLDHIHNFLGMILHPMEMAKSIGFLTSFPNIDSNKDIFIAKCIVELK